MLNLFLNLFIIELNRHKKYDQISVIIIKQVIGLPHSKVIIVELYGSIKAIFLIMNIFNIFKSLLNRQYKSLLCQSYKYKLLLYENSRSISIDTIHNFFFQNTKKMYF